jgi:4,5-DOPA dioxygenase extradiol
MTLAGERVPLGWSPPGAPELAHELHELVPGLARDPDRGWDEGVWGPLRCMFPEADVPVLQLSLVRGTPPRKLYALGRRLGALASLGYLVVGSGAFTHDAENLSPLLDAEPSPFARAFDAWASNALADAEMDVLLRWSAEGPDARRANPAGEHLAPLFVVAGAASLHEHAVGFPVRGFARATVSLRCVQFGRPAAAHDGVSGSARAS